MDLITSIGGRDSNSYVTVAQADIIMATLPDDTAEWDALTEADKTYRLIMAAMSMKLMMWKGKKCYCGQMLSFPRTFQNVAHSIPQPIKEVQCFIAYSVIHRALANRPDSVSEAFTSSRVTEISLGGLLSVKFSGAAITAGAGLEKIVRAATFPAYLTVLGYLTQFRGGTVCDEDEIRCSTTTTVTTTTSTTTTTVTESTTTTTT